jgi:hypothetical protein
MPHATSERQRWYMPRRQGLVIIFLIFFMDPSTALSPRQR